MSKRKVKSNENKNLVWRRDCSTYSCRWMLNGELKQQSLRDDHGMAMTDIDKACTALNKLLAFHAIKERDWARLGLGESAMWPRLFAGYVWP